MLPPMPLGEDSSLPLPASGNPRHSLVYCSITPTSVSIFTWLSSPYPWVFAPTYSIFLPVSPFFLLTRTPVKLYYGSLPRWCSDNLPNNSGDADLIPGSRRSPGVGHGNPLQYSCLGNLMVRAAWQAKVHGAEKCQTRVSTFVVHRIRQ